MANLFKSDVVAKLAEKTGMTKIDSKKALEGFVDLVTDAMSKGDKITIVGWGSFSVTKRSERQSTNPSTGKPMTVPAKNVVKFKPGNELSEVVNK